MKLKSILELYLQTTIILFGVPLKRIFFCKNKAKFKRNLHLIIHFVDENKTYFHEKNNFISMNFYKAIH